MSTAIVENLKNVMTPDELGRIFDEVVYHGAPWPMGPVEIRPLAICRFCPAPVERDGETCQLCLADEERRFHPCTTNN